MQFITGVLLKPNFVCLTVPIFSSVVLAVAVVFISSTQAQILYSPYYPVYAPYHTTYVAGAVPAYAPYYSTYYGFIGSNKGAAMNRQPQVTQKSGLINN